MWKHLSYREFEDLFGDLGLTTWVKFNWLAEVPDGYGKIDLGDSSKVYWTKSSDGVFLTQSINYTTADNSVLPICFKYTPKSVAAGNADAYTKGNMTCCYRTGATFDRFYVRDDALFAGTAEAFGKANKGVWLIYKKPE